MTQRKAMRLSYRNQAASTVTLALWRSRQTWPLLLITCLGLVAAVILACLVPLLSSVMMTASLHDLLHADPRNSTIYLDSPTPGISSRTSAAFHQEFDTAMKKELQPYLRSYTEDRLFIPNLEVQQPDWPAQPYALRLTAFTPQQVAPFVQLLQGRLPSDSMLNGEIEVMLHPDEAADFHVSVGDAFTIKLKPTFLAFDDHGKPLQMHSPAFKLRVVGIFKALSPNDPIWNGTDFQPYDVNNTSFYSLFVPFHAFLQACDARNLDLQRSANYASTVYTFGRNYYLNTSSLTIDQLDALMQHLQRFQTTLTNTYGDLQGQGAPFRGAPFAFSKVTLVSPLFNFPDQPGILDTYNSRLALARIPVLLLTLQVVALMLYFVSLMADLLVDRQNNALAVIRSRGASAGQVFASLLTQAILLCISALLLGPPLALLAALMIARTVLDPSAHSALQAILAQPLLALWTTRWYALGVALVALGTISLSLLRVLRMDVLASRREAARTTYKPFWQRFYLDSIAAAIAFLGYAISLYLSNVNSLLDIRSQNLILVPLSLITPLFLALGCLLLFLRFFPLLLRLAAWLSLRSRGAAAMLALAQMARSPRQCVRMTMLLALATAFTIFTLIFSASQQQRVSDLANYESGADFRGTRSALSSPIGIKEAQKIYGHLPGVLAMTPGWNATGYPTSKGASVRIEMRAIDADTFASTAYWNIQPGAVPLSQLMVRLQKMRAAATQKNTIPAIIDANMRDHLNLRPGSTFSVDTQALHFQLTYVVVGMVTHIPTVNDNTDLSNTSSESDLPSAGILMDYQTMANVYQQNLSLLGASNDFNVNQIWLRTGSDPSTLARLRQSLASVDSPLINIYDRRQLAKSLASDPLHLNLVSILLVGVSAALLLALLGDLLISWFNARSRLTNFAVLRAIGTGPRQVAGVFSWEQLIIYTTALALGILFGTIFAYTVVPVLLFNSQPTQGVLVDLDANQFYALQHVIPTTIVIPQSLALAFAILVLICFLALALMVRIVARPSLAQTLRLNED